MLLHVLMKFRKGTPKSQKKGVIYGNVHRFFGARNPGRRSDIILVLNDTEVSGPCPQLAPV